MPVTSGGSSGEPRAPGKAELRRSVLLRRQDRPTGPDLGAVVRSVLQDSTRVAAFVGMPGEPHVEPRPGWLLPVLLDDGDLDWAPYDGRLVTSRGFAQPVGKTLGVAAVADCDVVLVPALLVDRDGYRLGRGGGSYDRALARAGGLTVALVHDDELVDAVPREPHDVPVRCAATPGGLVHLPRR